MQRKTILPLITLIVVIGGSLLLYNVLQDKVLPQDRLETQSTPTVPPGSKANETSPETATDKRIMAPDFIVKDTAGNDVKLSDMLGKPVVLYFWASWCPPCKSEMPDFDKVFAELGDDIQFMMVDAVDGYRETQAKGAAFIAEQGYLFPVYFDIDQTVITQYGIRAFPTSIFIDKDGYIIAGVEGAIDEETLRKGIEIIAATSNTASTPPK